MLKIFINLDRFQAHNDSIQTPAKFVPMVFHPFEEMKDFRKNAHACLPWPPENNMKVNKRPNNTQIELEPPKSLNCAKNMA